MTEKSYEEMSSDEKLVSLAERFDAFIEAFKEEEKQRIELAVRVQDMEEQLDRLTSIVERCLHVVKNHAHSEGAVVVSVDEAFR